MKTVSTLCKDNNTLTKNPQKTHKLTATSQKQDQIKKLKPILLKHFCRQMYVFKLRGNKDNAAN